MTNNNKTVVGTLKGLVEEAYAPKFDKQPYTLVVLELGRTGEVIEGREKKHHVAFWVNTTSQIKPETFNGDIRNMKGKTYTFSVTESKKYIPFDKETKEPKPDEWRANHTINHFVQEETPRELGIMPQQEGIFRSMVMEQLTRWYSAQGISPDELSTPEGIAKYNLIFNNILAVADKSYAQTSEVEVEKAEEKAEEQAELFPEISQTQPF